MNRLTTVVVGLFTLFSNIAWTEVPPKKLKAEYNVPVPSALMGPATFPINEISLKTSPEKTRTIEFTLPEDLTGEKKLKVELQEVKEKNPTDFIQFNDPKGLANARCLTSKSKSMVCLIHYNLGYQAQIDSKSVGEFLTRKYANLAKREQAIDIATRFSGDAAGGVLRIVFE
jgi:hypothetical protein